MGRTGRAGRPGRPRRRLPASSPPWPSPSPPATGPRRPTSAAPSPSWPNDRFGERPARRCWSPGSAATAPGGSPAPCGGEGGEEPERRPAAARPRQGGALPRPRRLRGRPAHAATGRRRRRRRRAAAQGVTARLMAEQSWGRWVVGARRRRHHRVRRSGRSAAASTQKFRKRLERVVRARPRRHHRASAWSATSPAGPVIAVIGWLFVRAARNFDPNQPLGVDAALREVLHAPGRPARSASPSPLGLGAYGLYSFGEARYRQIS